MKVITVKFENRAAAMVLAVHFIQHGTPFKYLGERGNNSVVVEGVGADEQLLNGVIRNCGIMQDEYEFV